MPGRSRDTVDTERILRLARELAASDSGPARELGCAVAEAVVILSRRVTELYELIGAALEAAGLGAGPTGNGGPSPEFVRALTAPDGRDQGVALTIGGRQWVAAINQDRPPADPAAAWAALERITAPAEEPATNTPAES
jgi:hypothetical protein